MAEGNMLVGDSTGIVGFSRFEHATVGALYMLFSVVGVTTNFLTALTFYKDTKLLGASKPWLHIGLALTNVGVVAPSFLPASSSFSGRWLYGNTMCQLYAFEGMFIGIAAIGMVVAICMERYFVGSQAGAKEASGWFYGWSIILVLGNAFFWAVMPLLGWSGYDVDSTGTTCALLWANPDESYTSYMLTLDTFSFVLPMLVAWLCLYYSKDETTPRAEGQGQGEGQAQVVAADVKDGFSEDQLKSLCYIFTIFVVAGWGPFAFLCNAVILGGSSGISDLGACLAPLACKLVTSAYPLAYATCSPRFRRSFKSMLGVRGEKND